MKKITGGIIICTKNHNHMMYGFSDMVWDRQSFCHFGQFLSFYPTNNLKNKNFEKNEKTPGDIIILHICVP